MTIPRILVFTTNFPSAAAPIMGAFIRERAFRVANRLPMVVVAPQPWSPIDGIIRIFRASFRPQAIAFEIVDGIDVYRPRFFSVPSLFKRFDGWLMAQGARRIVTQLQKSFRPNVIDAHFLFPDGYAAVLLGRSLGLPVAITIRGSKDRSLIGTNCEPMLRSAVRSATRLFAVSESLRHDVGERLGVPPERIVVVGNGIDLGRFQPVDRLRARDRLGIAADARVIIGVGSLVEGKGFHRVISLVRRLQEKFPNLVYLIVGGASSKGDLEEQLKRLVKNEGVTDSVRFCGRQPPEDLMWYYGAADVLVMATEYEGWSNVLLEAMACGLPVVTTRVGGNAEVVSASSLGELVEFWNPSAFVDAVSRALERTWDREAIIAYARSNEWSGRIDVLEREFRAMVNSAESA